MEKNAGLKFTFIAILVVLWLLFFYLAGINLGLDLKGGFELVYKLELPREKTWTPKVVENTIAVLQKRIDILGLKEIKIKSFGREHIMVDLPGGSEEEKDNTKRIIEKMGVLWFALIDKQKTPSRNAYEFTDKEIKDVREEEEKTITRNRRLKAENKPPEVPRRQVLPFVERNEKGEETKRFETIVDNTDRVSGSNLSDVYETRDNMQRPAVGFAFNAIGAVEFSTLTQEENRGRFLAIILDGIIQSAPVIRATISDRGVIEGNFTRDEVRQNIITLKSGSLPTKPVLVREFMLGPMLGERAIRRGVVAIMISIAAVIVIMGAYYLAAGMIANLALIINMILILGSLAASEATFTLPGLAGLVLTIGMAVDANILIFERIREEKAKGKSLRQATETGFARAFWTIFDANVTTLLTALILLWAGTGPIQGFAVTLSIGILCSMFTALFVTRAFLGFLIDKHAIKTLKMGQIFKKPSFGFVKVRHAVFTMSMILIIGGLYLFFSRGPEKYGIEFTGGSLFEISFREPKSIVKIKETVEKIEGMNDAEIVASYHKLRGEQPGRGISVSFTIRTRTVLSGETEEETGRAKELQEVLQAHINEVFKDKLAPKALHSSEAIEDEQRKLKNEGKALCYLFLRKTAKEEEAAEPEETGESEETAEPEEAGEPEGAPEPGQTTEPAGSGSPGEDTEPQEDTQPAGTGNPEGTGQPDETPGPEETAGPTQPRGTPGERGLANRATRVLNDSGFYGAKAAVAQIDDPSLENFTLLRIETNTIDGEKLSFLKTSLQKVIARIINTLKDKGLRISEPFPLIDTIGPDVARNLKSKAVVALTLAMIAIILYIAVRFELKYGFAAVFALGHDVAIALGAVTLVDMFGLVEMKIDLPIIAAFLTIVGYSLNDTIVVFDRIRENLRRKEFDAKKSKESYAEIINDSINETISRTLLTSFTTFVVVLIFFLSGVEAIAGFTFAMLVGVVVGTYSSIFIASPILIFMRSKELKRK